jgi:hypothetical protein
MGKQDRGSHHGGKEVEVVVIYGKELPHSSLMYYNYLP